jgi:hypothetical protein
MVDDADDGWLEEEDDDDFDVTVDYSDRICCEDGCEYAPVDGYTVCVKHLYGSPNFASENARRWKSSRGKLLRDV